MSFQVKIVSGPLKGQNFPLKEGEDLPIGRTSRGINLPDPGVSVEHAVVKLRGDRVLIIDLNSAKGSKVNERDLEPQKAFLLQEGDRITIGMSTLSIDSLSYRFRRLASLAAFGVVLSLAGVVAVGWWSSGAPSEDLPLAKAIRTSSGETNRPTLPERFVRRHGIPRSLLSLVHVTDFNENDLDELWLSDGQHEWLLEFKEDGPVLLGKLPPGCKPLSTGQHDLRCATGVFREMSGGYRLASIANPVAFLQGPVRGVVTADGKPAAPPGEDGRGPARHARATWLDSGGVVPYTVSMGSMENLAGFLGERGITEPVHYLLCEDLVEGIPAQVVTARGESRLLSRPCEDLSVTGPHRGAYAEAAVRAVAFTAAGLDGLHKHMAYTLSGYEGRLFLDPAQEGLVLSLAKTPVDQVGGLVMDWGPNVYVFNAISQGDLKTRVRLESTFPPPPDVVAAVLEGPGSAKIPVGRCGPLHVDVQASRCALLRGCVPGATFVTITESACDAGEGVLVATGYGAGRWSGDSVSNEIRVRQSVSSSMLTTDIVQVEVGVRPR